MKKVAVVLAMLAVLLMAASAQAAIIDFNVYYAGDAGGQSLANKSWVAGMVNISSGAQDIGGGTTVTLQDKDFDAGPTKNYGGTPNTIGIFALGANTTGDGTNDYSASVTNAAGMTSVSLYFGNYENFDATPVVWLPGETHSYPGWSGTVTGVMNAGGTSLVITGDPGHVGTHIFAGTVTATSGTVVPEPAGLGLIGLALLAVRKRRS